ncbi:MAG TPA: 50S ribosomal protein L32 [Candidatus Glassbacteria bacterium]|nr:50S ribosomal protein L32 [Candidatus Glassbacteria bacterium]
MAVPRTRSSKSHKRKRRTHYKLTAPSASLCPNCGQQKQPHKVCPHCGHYNGREVLEVEE